MHPILLFDIIDEEQPWESLVYHPVFILTIIYEKPLTLRKNERVQRHKEDDINCTIKIKQHFIHLNSRKAEIDNELHTLNKYNT